MTYPIHISGNNDDKKPLKRSLPTDAKQSLTENEAELMVIHSCFER